MFCQLLTARPAAGAGAACLYVRIAAAVRAIDVQPGMKGVRHVLRA